MAIIAAAALLLLAGWLLFYAVTLYNGLVFVKNNVEKAWANIDVLLKQRHDEIPKLIKICEAYMKFEQETLQKVIAARSAAFQAQGVAQRAQAEGALTQALHGVFAVAERYPDLKAQDSFKQLQGRVSELENQLADRREFYNEAVNIYNVRLETMPDMLVARQLGYQPSQYFKVSEADRSDVAVDIKTP